jgi:hypothetical protein
MDNRSIGFHPGSKEGRKEITIVVDGHGDLSLRVSEKNSRVVKPARRLAPATGAVIQWKDFDY